jgi:ATP-dependent Clp protease protease subunit
MKWFNVKNLNGVGEIYIYGEITDDKWYDTDVTPTDIARQLKELENVSELKLYVNSPGGGVYAGVAIFNALKRFGKPITAYIDGVAASIASLIVLAADEVVMPSNAQLMIHNPYLWGTSGDANALRQTADRLDRVKDIIVDTYKAKTGLDDEKLSQMMDEETWLRGPEALELGFVDSVDEEQKIAACFSGENVKFKNVEFDPSKFRNFPRDGIEEEAPKDESIPQNKRHRHKMTMLSAQL